MPNGVVGNNGKLLETVLFYNKNFKNHLYGTNSLFLMHINKKSAFGAQ
jgi:hypothetical protein